MTNKTIFDLNKETFIDFFFHNSEKSIEDVEKEIDDLLKKELGNEYDDTFAPNLLTRVARETIFISTLLERLEFCDIKKKISFCEKSPTLILVGPKGYCELLCNVSHDFTVKENVIDSDDSEYILTVII